MNRTTVLNLHVNNPEKQLTHQSGSRVVAAILLRLVFVGIPEQKVTYCSPTFR
jgi:hypothetical protein